MNALSSHNANTIVDFDTPSDARLGAFLKLATRMDWEIISYDHIGIQLRQKKRYGAGYYFAGALTAIIGIGILIWILGWIDYATSRDRLIYIPRADLMNNDAATIANRLL